MTTKREYLVALDARSTLNAWIAAASEDDALQQAEELYAENESAFTAKGSSIDSVTVLESRAAKPKSKKFAVAFEQPVVHRIIVEADDLDDAYERATTIYLNKHGFFTNDPPDRWDPPEGWERTFGKWDIVDAEEVQP